MEAPKVFSRNSPRAGAWWRGVAEDVGEGRTVRARRMGRRRAVAESTPRLARAGHRDDAPLVHEQHIDRLGHLRRCPQPRGPGGEVGSPVVEASSNLAGVLATRHPPVVEDLLVVALFLPAWNRGLLTHRAQEVADDLVARALAHLPDALAGRSLARR